MKREARRALLAEQALAVGARWAQLWCDQMRRDGRPVAGGWPGTLPEARARVRAHFGPELARRHLPMLSDAELVWVVETTYQQAKRDWLAVPARRTRRSRRHAPPATDIG